MDINLNQLIDHLPNDSTFKSLLETLGESGNTIDATVEFYHLVEALYQAQQAYNQQSGNQAISMVSAETVGPVTGNLNGTFSRRLERTLTFFRKYEDSVIVPKT
ncbi:MAG: hypothetical protein KFF72_08615 [Arthrospira sp. SH-MAG29]|nr:hypothetical protein [Arthrospira sp. SH-MAG29]MBS0016408.1 hypothetical protein [Arthrospira sp. SH-MAG29]